MKILLLIIMGISYLSSYEGKVCGAKIDLSNSTKKYFIGIPKNTKTFESIKQMKKNKYVLIHLGECKD
jgi:hypothetical protein